MDTAFTAGLATGITVGAAAVTAAAQHIRRRNRTEQPPPVIVRLYIDDDGHMRLGQHPAGSALRDTRRAELEVDMRDTRPNREWSTAVERQRTAPRGTTLFGERLRLLGDR